LNPTDPPSLALTESPSGTVSRETVPSQASTNSPGAPDATPDWPPVCDYEGSAYESEFWVGQGRDYEDRVERIALRRLLPPQGRTLIDIGAGFGRLVDMYDGYEHVILVDYSRSLLRQARQRLGDGNGHFTFVAANIYALPFPGPTADAVVMVRVIHHLQDVPTALAQVARTLRPQGRLILEFANKCNFKAIARHWLGRQTWNPFTTEPVEFVALNYNFHPRWITQEMLQAGLHIEARRSVSHFRLGLLKRAVPLDVLVALDSAAQPTGRWWQLSPSVFLRARPANAIQDSTSDSAVLRFACPSCGNADLVEQPDCLACGRCGRRWRRSDGIYDFKEPL
jgi:ubiquinone/menaquinone biosynthesis C-methylase UbiE